MGVSDVSGVSGLFYPRQSARVTSWALSAASAWTVRTACASVPQGSASVGRRSRVWRVTTALLTTGTWPAGGAVSPAAAIPTTPSPLPVMR